MRIYAGSEEHGEVPECEAVIQKPADDQEGVVLSACRGRQHVQSVEKLIVSVEPLACSQP